MTVAEASALLGVGPVDRLYSPDVAQASKNRGERDDEQADDAQAENDGEQEKKKRHSRSVIVFSGENKLMDFARASSWTVNGASTDAYSTWIFSSLMIWPQRTVSAAAKLESSAGVEVLIS